MRDLERYIQDWHWDEASHAFAREMGAFLFQFIDDLKAANLSERTLRKHLGNCQLIGWLVSQYGYYQAFSPTIFLGAPGYLIEFRRKVRDSKYMVASYEATWRRVGRYVRALGYGE